jgi:hypothetical protein
MLWYQYSDRGSPCSLEALSRSGLDDVGDRGIQSVADAAHGLPSRASHVG